MKNNVSRVILGVFATLCMAGVVVATVMALRDDNGGGEVSENEAVEERAKTQAEIDNEDEGIPTVVSIAEWTLDIRDAEVVAEKSSNIAIVRIDEISGFGNYSEVTGEYMMPYTYGKMTVLQNVKGELPLDKELKFYRMGGILTAEEYYTGLGEEMKAEYGEMNADDPELWTKKMRYVTEGDIKLELGKEYLVYLVPDTVYDQRGEAYGMILAQGGTREVRSGVNGEWTEVLNNFTGEWEKLSDVVEVK